MISAVDYVASACTILADLLLLILTWIKTFKLWLELRRLKMPTSITTLLLRDGGLILREPKGY